MGPYAKPKGDQGPTLAIMGIFPIHVTGIIPITVMGSHSSHRAYGNYSHNHYGKRLSFHKAYGKMGPYTTKVMV